MESAEFSPLEKAKKAPELDHNAQALESYRIIEGLEVSPRDTEAPVARNVSEGLQRSSPCHSFAQCLI